jgi:peptide subunit release factor 1 (eRF1)
MPCCICSCLCEWSHLAHSSENTHNLRKANLMGTAQSGTQLTKTRKVEKGTDSPNISTLLAVLTAGVACIEQQLAVDDLAKRLKREEAKLDWIKNYLGRMMQTRDTIGGIATKLTAVSHIWLLVRTTCRCGAGLC